MKNKYYIRSLFIGILLAVLLTFIQLPYYVTKPGSAQELEPIIEVSSGFEEEGSFLLTTVRMGQANIFSFVWAKLNKYHMIYPVKQIRADHESDEEYNYRQLHAMENSQEAAILVAFKRANKEVSFNYHGVYVLRLIADMPANNELQVGDRIFKVDDLAITTSEEFIEYVSEKKEGESVTLSFERDGEEMKAIIPITPFPKQPDKVGIGIGLVTDKEIHTNPKITIDTDNIGGPSAGLMFALEIYNQLLKEDLTHGKRIAGTGTINEKGQVGPIGGISQKIVAAHNNDVDIFFAPNENGKKNSDYKEALKTAKEIKTKMKIVPVDTFEDALEYLESLEKDS